MTDQQAVTTQRPGSPRRLWAIPIIVIVIAVAISAWAYTATRPKPAATFHVIGNLLVSNPSCTLPAGYSDISAGTQVVVTDGAGVTVAVGRLDAGRFEPDPQFGIYLGHCSFYFDVSDVPKGKGFYGVAVGNRGSMKYTEADIVAKPVELTLGG